MISYAGGWSLRIPFTDFSIYFLYADNFLQFWPRMILNKLDKNIGAKTFNFSKNWKLAFEKFFSRYPIGFWKILNSKKVKNELENNNEKICSRSSETVFHKIIFTANSLNGDHPPAWELMVPLGVPLFLINQKSYILKHDR